MQSYSTSFYNYDYRTFKIALLKKIFNIPHIEINNLNFPVNVTNFINKTHSISLDIENEEALLSFLWDTKVNESFNVLHSLFEIANANNDKIMIKYILENATRKHIKEIFHLIFMQENIELLVKSSWLCPGILGNHFLEDIFKKEKPETIDNEEMKTAKVKFINDTYATYTKQIKDKDPIFYLTAQLLNSFKYYFLSLVDEITVTEIRDCIHYLEAQPVFTWDKGTKGLIEHLEHKLLLLTEEGSEYNQPIVGYKRQRPSDNEGIYKKPADNKPEARKPTYKRNKRRERQRPLITTLFEDKNVSDHSCEGSSSTHFKRNNN